MLFSAVLLSLAPTPAAQDTPRGPQDEVFFLQDVRIWQADGEPTGPHQILLRGGLVAAVGGPDQELRPVPGAKVIDGGGEWVVYPGLVHGQYPEGAGETPRSPFADEASDARQGPIPQMEWGSRKDLRAWFHLADAATWDAGKAKPWRDAGFTSAYLLPTVGLVRGRAAWVSLNDRPLGQALLEREGRMTLGLRAAGGGYPRTPMATLATLRQAFLDADRHAALAAHGGVRAREDADLAALAARPEEPLLFVAQSVREIENALELMHDFGGGRQLVIVGGREAHKLADSLREARASVLFTLDLDDAPKADEDLDLDPVEARPYWQSATRRRELERADHARAVAGFRELRATGVPCALVPAASSPKALVDDLTQLEEDGLDADTLWRAMSADVADLLGLEGVGSVAQGRAADLVAFPEAWSPGDAEPTWVFADGRGWEFEQKEVDEDDEGDSAASGADEEFDAALFAGTWEMTVSTPEGDQSFEAVVDTDTPKVVLRSPELGDETMTSDSVSFENDEMRFRFTIPDMDLQVEVDAVVTDDQAEGIANTPFGGFELSGVRVDAGPVAAAPEPDEPEEGQEEDETLPEGPDRGHPEALVETREDRIPPSEWSGDVLLRGATLYPMTGEAPYVGDVLIQDGKIAGIGTEIHTLAAVPTVDLSGMHLMPAVIDAHSHLALDSVNEGSVAISAECRIADMIHPEQVGIWRAAAGGTAVALALHGSANPIGGQAAVWTLDYFEPSRRALLFDAKQGIKFALGENVKDGGPRFPGTRSGVQAVYRRAFTAAQDYAAARARHAAGEEPTFRRDVRLEVLADVLENRIHIQCHSYRADEIQMFLGVCEEFGIEAPTFQHVLEGYKVAPELAAYGAMASTFSDWWAYKIEAYDAIPWNAALMTKAGVISTINSDSGEMIRRLNTEAGKSLLYGGLSYDQSMALCTLNAAKQLRIDHRMGTLEVGKDGSVTVYDAPPLSTYARCVLTLAEGRALFEANPEHERRWSDYVTAVRSYAAREAATREEDEASATAEAAAKDEGDWERWTRAGRGSATLIHNARVHPITAASFDGAVLVQDGRIAWMGAQHDGTLPEGTQVVDAGGMSLYPGFLNTGDTIGLYEIGQVGATRDDRETGEVHPDLSLASAIHADSAHHRVHRMTGITHVLVRTRSGLIGGQAALIQLDGETTDEMVTVPDLALLIRYPRVAQPKPGKEPERPDAVKRLDEWFDDALAYDARRSELATSARSIEQRDRRLEALVPYAKGEKPVLLSADDPLGIMGARAWAAERGLEAIFAVGQESWKVAGHLGGDGARVLCAPIHATPRNRHDPYDAPFRAPGVLDAAGCTVALATLDPEITRNLPFQAATAAVHGWSRERALHALTIGAAEALGVAEFTGSLEVGKAANLFLADGDPLDFEGSVRRMWIGGREVELRSKQTDLRDRYEARIERAAAAR